MDSTKPTKVSVVVHGVRETQTKGFLPKAPATAKAEAAELFSHSMAVRWEPNIADSVIRSSLSSFPGQKPTLPS